jgi:hypothetical protein
MNAILKQSTKLIFAVVMIFNLANCKDNSEKADLANTETSKTPEPQEKTPIDTTQDAAAMALAKTTAEALEQKKWSELVDAVAEALKQTSSSAQNIKKLLTLAEQFEDSYRAFERYGYFKSEYENDEGRFQNLEGKLALLEAQTKIAGFLASVKDFKSLKNQENFRSTVYDIYDNESGMKYYERECLENKEASWGQIGGDGYKLPVPDGAVAAEFNKICAAKLPIFQRAKFIYSEEENHHQLDDRPEALCVAELSPAPKNLLKIELDFCNAARQTVRNREQVIGNWDHFYNTAERIQKMKDAQKLIQGILYKQFNVEPIWMEN